jgi:hypothetical protein
MGPTGRGVAGRASKMVLGGENEPMLEFFCGASVAYLTYRPEWTARLRSGDSQPIGDSHVQAEAAHLP